MAHLIIGDTTETTVRIWIRGDRSHRACEVSLHPPDDRPKPIVLGERTDYTGTVDFAGLRADTEYKVAVVFALEDEPAARGRFHTLRASGDDPLEFSFVLSSCNLSVVSIGNLLAFLAASAGTALAGTSLDLPVDRWAFPSWSWTRPVLRPLLKLGLRGLAGAILSATGIKQPGPPYLRSPFLKLSAVFDALDLEVTNVGVFPAVGDVVRAAGATGVVASSPPDPKTEDKTWHVVITQVDGTFERSDLWSQRNERTFGRIVDLKPALEWRDRPAFFLHVGDQIYYDFPNEERFPDRNQYRLSYREAWFDDNANRHFLANWSHYMILDDHEIADQFARDFVPPAPDATGDRYLREALVAYREYVHARNPSPEPSSAPEAARESYWYRFDKGTTRFFVLDTRTQRVDRIGRNGQMIDREQMDALLTWMSDYKDDLKFVVTSIPFVAEITEEKSAHPARWRRDEPDRNPPNDKWGADRFRAQRNQVIDYIFDHGIRHLVFLTGDMHCCYHAAMHIGTGSKYETLTVHELSGGPVNQLQLAILSEFHTRRLERTPDRQKGSKVVPGVPYEVVLDRFQSEVNAVMHLKVSHVERERVTNSDPRWTPEVEWNVIRTVTENSASAWQPAERAASRGNTCSAAEKAAQSLAEQPGDRAGSGDTPRGERTMAGTIRFTTKRKVADLRRWP